MKKQRVTDTQWKEIREVLHTFLNLDIQVNEKFAFIVHHPFFDSPAVFLPDGKLLDITASEDNLEKAREVLRAEIDNTHSLGKMVCLLNKPYLMTVFSYIEPYLNLHDFSILLGEIWTRMEFPSACPDVNISTLIRYFQQADMEVLMGEEEYKIYQSLPEVLTVYRGVGDSLKGKSGNPKGLSYTLSYDMAEWFANRFGSGYVVKLEIPKSKVLAFFGGTEEEIVVNTRGLSPIRM